MCARKVVPDSLLSDLFHGRDTPVGYTARHDVIEISHVGTDVEREAVHRYPPPISEVN